MRQTKLTPRIVDAEFEVIKGPDAHPTPPWPIRPEIDLTPSKHPPGPRNWFERIMLWAAILAIGWASLVVALERATPNQAASVQPSPPAARSP